MTGALLISAQWNKYL